MTLWITIVNNVLNKNSTVLRYYEWKQLRHKPTAYLFFSACSLSEKQHSNMRGEWSVTLSQFMLILGQIGYFGTKNEQGLKLEEINVIDWILK